MGKNKKAGKTKERTDKGTKKGKPKKFLTRVVQYKMLTKMYLRGYAAGGGGSMLNNDGEAATKHFTMKKIMSDLDAEESKFDTELTRRPAMGVSMACGTVESSVEVITKNLPKLEDLSRTGVGIGSQLSDVDVPPAQHSYSITGVPAAHRIWMSDDGRKLRKAASYLNTAVERNRTLKDTKQALRTLRDHFGNKETAKARMKDYARLADFASRVYGGAIAQMELTTLFADQKKWAKMIQEVKLQPTKIQQWVRNPGDEKLFVAGLADAILTRSSKDKTRGRQKPGLPASEESGAAAESDGEASKGDSDKSHSDSDDSDKKGSDDDESGSDSDAKKSSDSDDDDKQASTQEAEKRTRRQKQDEQKARKLSWDEWHKLGIREGKDLTKALARLHVETLRRLAVGIESSEGISHAEAAIAKAKELLRCASSKESDDVADNAKSGPNGVRYDIWSLKDLQLFQAEAATLNIKHDMAKLEASRILKLLRVIPEPLRAAHGLPTSTKERDYEKLIRDCDRATESIFQIVKNTQLAWIEKASRECLPQHNVSFEPEYSGGGLLRAIASSDDVALANKDAIAEVLARVDEGDACAVATMKQMEAEYVRSLIDEDVAGLIYEEAIVFAKTFEKAEPSKDQIREFVKPLSDDLRAALGINKDAKFEKSKNRPHGWKQDACRAFSVYCLAFAAWTREFGS